VLLLLTRPVVWSAILLWLLLAVALCRPVAARFRLAPWPTLGALLSAAVIGVVTLTPDGWYGLRDPGSCLRVTAAELHSAGLHLLSGPQQLFNVLLFVPLGFFLVLTTGRFRWSAVTVLVLPVLIEVAQATFARRVCAVLDWFDNTLGGLIGAAVGVVALAVLRRAVD
jgi:hypothetical protein